MGSERDKTLEELFSPLEELTSSDEETRKLREIASGLFSMEKAEFSSSFRDSLRDSLLQKMRRQQAVNAGRHKISGNWLSRFYQDLLRPATNRFRPVFALAAAAVLIVTVITVSSNPQESIPRFRAVDHRNSADPYIMAEGSIGTEEKVLPEEQPDSQTSADPPSLEERSTGEPVNEPRDLPSNNIEQPGDNLGAGETPGAKAAAEGAVPNENESPAPDDSPGELPLPEKPQFQIEKEIVDLRLAGAVVLSPLYIGNGEEESSKHDNVSANFIPNKYAAVAAENDAAVFGSNAWAANLLKNQGFMVKSQDSLEIKTQETQQGCFAEIFYQPGGKGSRHPVLVLHSEEQGKILGYYYQEKGRNREAGYYALASPAQVLKTQQMTVFSSSKPSLIFSEVELTFNNFLLNEGGVQKNVTLPAYCFTGMDTTTNSKVKICLPAVSR